MPIITKKPQTRVALCYKNFAAFKGISHIGLGVSAMQKAKVFRDKGVMAEVWPVLSAEEIEKRLAEDKQTQTLPHHIPISHVIISALWVPTVKIAHLVYTYPDIEFAIISHSNIGFLQADPQAIKLLREGSDLAHGQSNFHIAGNSNKLVNWWNVTYGDEMLYLPNLYPLPNKINYKHWKSGTELRIGCFCGIRILKNILTAAAAALEIGVRLRVPCLEFWMSDGRMEGGQSVVQAIKEMYEGVPRVAIRTNNWQSWPQFVHTVGSMDLLLQPSFTESFNLTVADGISQGIPSVVSEAIDWVPSDWIANADDASDIANHGIALLHDPNAAERGVTALKSYTENGFREWSSNFFSLGYK